MIYEPGKKRRFIAMRTAGTDAGLAPWSSGKSMHRRFIPVCTLAVAAVLWLSPAPANAQGTSTANITGVVTDTSGKVLPGVAVEAASPALIERVRNAVTDEQGQYRLSELQPGTYVLTFTQQGFATLKRDGLELRTNFTAQVDIAMTIGQLQQTIEVTA